jgi:hypothetical protein
MCDFVSHHHQIVIHQWGWTLVLNPDGTTTAWNKDKTGTRPRSSTATARPPGPGKTPGRSFTSADGPVSLASGCRC